MKKMRDRNRKIYAAIFLLLFSIETFYPGVALALTSGPAQPEMKKFEPAGTSDLVDLFTGDFKENIPLLDVGGYPLNLSYHSGTSMEEESSWVGMGWSLNPGTVNRTLRGLPDDFAGGNDKIQKIFYKKDFKKAGGQILVKPTIFGFDNVVNNPSFKLDVYKDNYYGIGASFGASISFNLAEGKDTRLTAGLDFSSDSRDGVNIRPSLDLTTQREEICHDMESTTLSGSFLYNTRAGLKSWALDASYSVSDLATDELRNDRRQYTEMGGMTIGSYTHYFGQTYTPSLPTNTKSRGYTISLDAGAYIFGGYVGLGGSGYSYSERTIDNNKFMPAYGYINYLKGKDKDNALLDFNREKDGVYIPSAPSVAVPVATQDMFSVTGQAGGGQFRPFFGGNYVVADPKQSNVSDNGGGKLSVGGGWIWQLGGRLDYTHGDAVTKKWAKGDGNSYLINGEYAPDNSNPLEEPAYFKQVGEPTQTDGNFLNDIGSSDAIKVKLHSGSVSSTDIAYKTRSNANVAVSQPLKRRTRDKKNFNFSYLTADQASKYALDKQIISYQAGTAANFGNVVTQSSRSGDGFHQGNHMSEVTVTDNTGKRMVYGIPVYNLKQKEYNFAINHPATSDIDKARRTGLVQYSSNDMNTSSPQEKSKGAGNGNGRDGLVQQDVTPAYATGFLLTGVLSPDYVDVGNDGITDDDLGTAYKFNYSNYATSTTPYKWRAPYTSMSANFNEGLMSDAKDDKANIVYGEKELWYLRSMESKTMIAIFETSARKDGLGVLSADGGINTGATQLKLDAIKLYSKADWAKNGASATPIKVVHFEYDYSICPHVLNNTLVNGPDSDPANVKGGKLTLRKIYYTFGTSTRGQTNPYLFEYDTRPINPGNITGLPVPSISEEANDYYAERQGDRWGTYKQSWYNNPNPATGSTGYLNNAEYPYSLQKNAPPAGVGATDWSDLIDRLASKWQLNKITTPSGSVISIQYESDDYAYVQDKQAMQMYFIKGFEDANLNPSGLIHSQYIDVQLPTPLSATGSAGLSEFVDKYLDGTNVLYYKVYTNLKGDLNQSDITNKSFHDYVNGYATIDPTKCIVTGDRQTVKLFVNQTGQYSPIARQAWQKIKTDLPQYAYNGYDNSDLPGSELAIATEAIYWTLVNFREIWRSFDITASSAGMADKVDLTRSMVRLKSPTVSLSYSDGNRVFSKIGGGSRVRKIEVSDQWSAMVSGAKTATYGQEYKYTTTDNQRNQISSGVASYEPQGGSEENPFHQPISFTEKVHWGIDQNHFIEKPYGESYFPAPIVGYSKVTVTNYGDGNARETGYIVNEFYTAKDFPTQVDILTLDNPSSQDILPLLFFTQAKYDQATSQGVKIEINDMHGKPKAMHVFDKSGREIASTEYFYRVQDQNAEQKQLKNDGIPILGRDGSIDPAGATLATDIDLVTDVRQSKNENIGGSVGIYPGGFVIPIPPPFGPWYIPTFGVVPYYTYTNKSYYSTSTAKLISRYGMLSKVRTVKDGSSISAENVLWDGETGEVLLTKTQNEFNDYTYAFHYPAYRAYEGMGSAAKNISTLFTNMNITSDGKIWINGQDQASNKAFYDGCLFPGDELISTTGNVKGWVIYSNGLYRLIDKDGKFLVMSGSFYILRSGRRNMLDASAGTVVCMQNPMDGGRLSLDVTKKILDAKSITYNEAWSMPQFCPPQDIVTPPSGSGCADVCEGDQNNSYTQCGTHIWAPGYATDGTGTIQYWLQGNCWGGYCGNPPPGGALVAMTPAAKSAIPSAKRISDSLAAFSTVSPLSTSSSSGAAMPLVSIGPSPGCNVVPGTRTPANTWPLSRTSIWTCMGTSGGSRLPANSPIQFAACVQAPETKTYYVGFTADNEAAFYLDGQLVVRLKNGPGSVFNYWEVYPVQITKGAHTIILEGINYSGVAALGCEIYNNTAAQIAASTDPSQLNMLFTTKNVIGQHLGITGLSCPVGSTLTACGGSVGCVSHPADAAVFNPYYKDMLGNWHPGTSYVYTVNRVQIPGLAGQNGGTNIRQSGYYEVFNPFWQFPAIGSGGSLTNISDLDDKHRWVWNSAPIYYDQKGNEVENVDALNRYGAALFGYNQSFATAIAANARHNEVAFDGFEDYGFSLGAVAAGTCQPVRNIDWGFTNQSGTWTSSAGSISNTIAHTGNWSYKLSSTATISKSLGTVAPPSSFFNFDNLWRYQTTADEQAKGFAPILNKKYIISLWVNEDYSASNPSSNPSSNKVQKLDIKVNGVSLNPGASPVPVVEGWKRVEIPFIVSGSNFQLDLVPSGSVYVDDIRILPFDGQMVSYVYDDTNLRLVGQLDENNFATIYEYDAEGTPIRVKKETEKGVMTLKENRQSLITH